MNIDIDFLDIEKEIKYFEEFKEAVEKERLVKKEYKDIDDRILNENVDLVFKNMDISYLFSELMFKISFIRKFTTDLPDSIKEFYNKYSNQVYKRNFILDKGEIKELEEGVLEKKREEFLNSPFFKQMKEHLKTSSQ